MILRPRRPAKDRTRYHARPRWRTIFVLVGRIDVEGFGPVWVVFQCLQTRWSYSARRRLWRVPQ